MSTINAVVPTLIDITRGKNPDGTQAKVAEILAKDQEVLQHMPWKEGNLATGDRIAVRASLPSVGFRRINEGVARSKGTVRSYDEAAALLEANSFIDRKLAIIGGNAAQARWDDDKAFIEAMGQRMTTTLFYGNSTTAPKEFMGLTPRFNSLSGSTGNQIVDGGGTGTDNSSIWLIGWDVDKVYGIYPKGTIAGIQHMDTTANKAMAADGYPIGDEVLDALGNPYLAYKGHYEWNCGFAVKDPRYIARGANIDKSLLSKDFATGADLQDLMIRMLGQVKDVTPGMRFYMPRNIHTWAWRQSGYERRGFFDRSSSQGERPMLTFNGVPVVRTDALIADEARVT